MFSTVLIAAMMMINAPANNTVIVENDSAVELSAAQGVVFRSTQRLRSSDGRSLYFYSSGNCEMFDGDRHIVTCRYNVQNGEVRLLDEYGNTVYKGSYRMKSDGRNLSTITLAGTVYRAF